MAEIKCPKCGEIIKLDQSDYDALLRGIEKEEINKRVEEQCKNYEARIKAEYATLQERKNSEHKSVIFDLERKIESLNHRLENADKDAELKITEALEKAKEDLNARNIEINNLKHNIDSIKKENEISQTKIKEGYEKQLKDKQELVDYYKDLKTKMSTKLVGETLEQHCEIQFNQIRMTAFPKAYFEKDNDAKTGSKGDYIYRELDDNGNELLSIMFEMKNENDTTATKHKNEDFFKELDKDRTEKGCEYAVLVSMLEADSEYYNAGIVDVSYKYEKMYVVRPQCFIPMITLLRNAATRSTEYRNELALIKSKEIDVTNFEDKLKDFQEKFGNNYRLANERFQNAIEEIDKTIAHLSKVKDGLIGADRNLRLANDKLQDLSIKKLTRNNPTMKSKFDEVSQNKDESKEQQEDLSEKIAELLG